MERPRNNGRRMFLYLLQAMGLQPADYETGGLPGYGHAKIVDGPFNWPVIDTSQIGLPLPGILA